MAKNFTSEIRAFLGLHQAEEGQTRLKKGESPSMKNLKITPNYTLALREGYALVTSGEGEGRGVTFFNNSVIFVVGKSVYRLKNEEREALGELESDKGEVTFLPFGERLYILDGVKIKVVTGDSVEDIIPYVPLVAISTDSMGGGVPFEDVNLLTPERRQSFTLDGENSALILAEENIDSVEGVTLLGEPLSKGSYTVDLEGGVVTLKSGNKNTLPNAYEVTYSKSHGGERKIHKMRYATLWGGDNDTRAFLWGSEDEPLFYRYSGVHDGVSGMEYFPELSFNKLSSGSRVTSLVRHYDRLLVFTDKEAYYSYIEVKKDASGVEYFSFPLRTLSSEVGSSHSGTAVLVDNTPITIFGSTLYRWVSTGVRDERNAEDFGERIKRGLGVITREKVKTFDRRKTSELFIWSGENIYVYSYALDVFYYYEGFAPVGFAESDNGETYFLSRDGALCRFISESLDMGRCIPFEWESDYEDMAGLENKNIHRLVFELMPVSGTSFDIVWISDRMASRKWNIGVDYKVFDLASIFFDAFSFRTAITPVRLTKRVKLKRLRGFKIILKSDENNRDFHLLSLVAEGRITDAE